MRYVLFLTILVLVGCQVEDGKNTADTKTASIPSPKARELYKTTCSEEFTSPIFLDVEKTEYKIEEKKDGTKDVTCSLTNTNGLKTSHTETYKPSDANAFFNFCKIYYNASYWITFATPGYYTKTKPDEEPEALKPSEIGWQILNISNIPSSPADGYEFDERSCR